MRKFLFIILLTAGIIIESRGAELNLNAPDLSPLKTINKTDSPPIDLIVDGKCTLPIVIGKQPQTRVIWAADFLAESIEEMTGNKPTIVRQDSVEGKAIYIGNLEPLEKAELSSTKMLPGEFSVRSKDGSIYLYGNDINRSTGSAYAALDFAERVLGVRQYFETDQGGRTVIQTQNLTIPPLDYSDAPVFNKRDLWPYSNKKYLQTWRIADTHGVQLIVHAPHKWCKDQEYRKNRPEIFEKNKDGSRTTSPMLCYSNPKTLETYLERIEEELKDGRKSGILNGKSVTVSPWDKGVNCYCEDCRKLYDAEAGYSGSASKIMCDFVRRLSDALAKTHPDLTIIYLPYVNYCDIPEGTSFPAGNVEVQLCSMPGLAMFKESSVKKHEEKLIRDWATVTGRKIQNWHYICWPAEFTSAPYIYADTIIQHYRDTEQVTVGSFLNGGYPEARHLLSAYVWMKALWNPKLNSDKIFDSFSQRMFGPSAKPMRRIIQLQADGWKHPWKVARVSPKNIFEVSYPRSEVVEMEKCFKQAYELAGDDKLVKKRIDYYRSGFNPFFKESKEHEDGTAFDPLMIKKVADNPVVDGRLDDEKWHAAEALSFIRATDKKVKDPKYPTTVKAVWTPDGVTFGLHMTEPTPEKLWITEPAGSWNNDNIELFFDVTGTGAGDYYQIILDARNEGLLFIHASEPTGWKPKGIKSNIHKGKDFWSAELFIPFTEFDSRKEAQLPKTSSDGLFWIGNFTRHRKADGYQKDKLPGSTGEMSRLNTRYSFFSRDQNAFGKLKFVE